MTNDEFERLRQAANAGESARLDTARQISAAASEAASALQRFREAWTDAWRRSEIEGLYTHPDVIDLDLADGYWRPE